MREKKLEENISRLKEKLLKESFLDCYHVTEMKLFPREFFFRLKRVEFYPKMKFRLNENL